MRVALLCSGLGNINRGHEVFATHLFDLVGDSIDITLFKGGGETQPRERVIPNLGRNSACLDHIHVSVSLKWAVAVREQERHRIEAETFAFASLQPLLEGGFDIIHCLEMEVCDLVYDHRHLFHRIPKLLFSNGGAIPARALPRCDFVQEHTEHNLRYSAREKAFMIPHGVDLQRFRPGVPSDFRARHGIGPDAFVAISVGTVSRSHKRMDHVIRELAPLPHVHLLIVGQETSDTPAIKALGGELMGERITFTKVAHEDLPAVYAAADVFVLGSLFETFGIVYIEAMAMGLPVVCTNHINQRNIVKEGVFVDMNRPGALTAALQGADGAALREMGRRGRQVAEAHYDLQVLKRQYIEHYRRIAATEATLPRFTVADRLKSNLRNLWRRADDLVRGRAE